MEPWHRAGVDLTERVAYLIYRFDAMTDARRCRADYLAAAADVVGLVARSPAVTTPPAAGRYVLDTAALYRDLDAERTRRGLSWRGVARDTGLYSSLFTRLGAGEPPSVGPYLTLVAWLGRDRPPYAVPDAGDPAA